MLTLRSASLLVLLSLLYTAWAYQVNTIVLEPYLDEYFHVRQAQAYCTGDFGRWDPKITTPPGLYLISYCLHSLVKLVFPFSGCNVPELRLLNLFAGAFVLPFQLFSLRKSIRAQPGSGADHDDIHNVSNILLFPLLLFFSGLYYTDICSLILVLGVYQIYYRTRPAHAPSSLSPTVFLLGICALLMRQTNIFWVAIYPAGLSTVHYLKEIAVRSGEVLHDPPISEASIEDYFMTSWSLIKKTSRDPFSLLLNTWPAVAVIICFALFILINGSVVLGDKGNHVASIHTPQILYICPYFLFFSWPVILPHFFRLLSLQRLPRASVVILVLATMTAAVRFNTIIHPFTLADNRHYVFYVFKLLRHWPILKYLAVLGYLVSGWLVFAPLTAGSQPPEVTKFKEKARNDSAAGIQPIRVSFALVFLACTTLSIVTAPLVEPRYYLIPWVVWRLHIDVSTASEMRFLQGRLGHRWPKLASCMDRTFWLSMETTWHLLVTFITCYAFLYRGFEWESEPGKLQRFIW